MKVKILAVPHTLQGPHFIGYVKDPSYPKLLDQLFNGVDFVFEECGNKPSSHARDAAVKSLGADRYQDLDPSDRTAHGIKAKTGGQRLFDPANGRYYEFTSPADQLPREEYWVRIIGGQKFKNALAVVGLAHSLSFAFRLQASGFTVDEAISYTPYDRFQILNS
jgi:hypothetical protein